MPRMARAIAVGCAHHITQRGNNRQDVFMVDDDREAYLQILAEQAGKYGLGEKGQALDIGVPSVFRSLGCRGFLRSWAMALLMP